MFDNPVGAVPALFPKREFAVLFIKASTKALEPFDSRRGILDKVANRFWVVDVPACDQGVLLVEQPVIGFTDRGGDAALGPLRVRITDFRLSKHADGSELCYRQGETEPCQTAADD